MLGFQLSITKHFRRIAMLLDRQASQLRHSGGFTLIELMVVIAVAAILMAVTAPNFSAALVGTRLGSQADDLIGDLRLARSEAATRGAWVVVCPSADGGATCSASAADWAKGRLVFVDSDRSGTRATTETVLRSVAALSGATSMASSGFSDAIITFSPYGGLLQGGVPAASGTFKLCSSSSASGRQVRVDASGRPSSTRVSCP
jgi:type IV fimbrial biogenesis protein FimT